LAISTGALGSEVPLAPQVLQQLLPVGTGTEVVVGEDQVERGRPDRVDRCARVRHHHDVAHLRFGQHGAQRGPHLAQVVDH
jgi:hypothetical protein